MGIHDLAGSTSGPLEVGSRGAVGKPLDLLLVDPDGQSARHTMRELEQIVRVQCVTRANGREALAELARSRFDAILTGQDLGDTDCWRWIRMLRSGRFGFAATPVFVLCASVELDALTPMADELTLLTPDYDISYMEACIRRIQEGGRRHTVLVVQDESRSVAQMEQTLKSFYRVDFAARGRDALQLFCSGRYDLVLLDLTLADIPGIDVLHRILAQNPGQPVIVLTAHNAPERLSEAMLAGASDFISKPIDAHLLPEICGRILRAQACLRSAHRSLTQESALLALIGRVRAASYHIQQGRAAHAAAHLRRAVLENPSHRPSDDYWAQLLEEFDQD